MADCRLFRKWLETCQQRHGDQCEPREAGPPSPRFSPRFIRLIDTDTKCLVQFSALQVQAQEVTWAALSCVWGPARVSVLTQASIRKFSEPGCFTASTIPKTAYDVIVLSARLGIPSSGPIAFASSRTQTLTRHYLFRRWTSSMLCQQSRSLMLLEKMPITACPEYRPLGRGNNNYST
jgi:hypothetical protein